VISAWRIKGLLVPVQHYRELIAWQKAIELVEVIYRATETFPRTETYGLTSQLRRAAISIPSNIAEGQGRNTTRDFLHFLSIAQGSVCEVETQIIVATRLGYVDMQREAILLETVAEVGRLLTGLRRSLTRKLNSAP
jgi:four helix bundle protein